MVPDLDQNPRISLADSRTAGRGHMPRSAASGSPAAITTRVFMRARQNSRGRDAEHFGARTAAPSEMNSVHRFARPLPPQPNPSFGRRRLTMRTRWSADTSRAARDDDVVTSLESFPGHPLAAELTCATPIHTVPAPRAHSLLFDHHVDEQMGDCGRNWTSFAFDRHALVFEVRGGEGMRCAFSRSRDSAERICARQRTEQPGNVS